MTDPHNPTSFTIGLIGAGKVGCALASGLAADGHQVVATTGGSDSTLARLEARLPGVPVLPANDVAQSASLVIVAVPDDSLAQVVESTTWRPGQIVWHVAGRYGVDILAPAARAGALCLAMHPALAFTGWSQDLTRMRGATFTVTCDPVVLPLAQALGQSFGATVVPLAAADRPLYHAALCHSGNHIVTLIAQAADLLATAGIKEPYDVLRAIVESAVGNVLNDGEAALTGPISRGDVQTIAGHLERLHTQATDDTILSYKSLALATVDRAERDLRLAAEPAQDIRETLNQTADNTVSSRETPAGKTSNTAAQGDKNETSSE